MEQLFKMAHDPSVDINEVMQDIGERAGSSFAIYCRMKEANSIKILQHQLANIEADRQETASAANRTDKLGIKLENFYTQNSSYDSGYINFGGTSGR
jgi:S-formylglutathione hydrolase FrmB